MHYQVYTEPYLLYMVVVPVLVVRCVMSPFILMQFHPFSDLGCLQLASPEKNYIGLVC